MSIGTGSAAVATGAAGFDECMEPVRLSFLVTAGALPVDTDSDLTVRFEVMGQFYQDLRHGPMNIAQKILNGLDRNILTLASNQALNFLHRVIYAHVKQAFTDFRRGGTRIACNSIIRAWRGRVPLLSGLQDRVAGR